MSTTQPSLLPPLKKGADCQEGDGGFAFDLGPAPAFRRSGFSRELFNGPRNINSSRLKPLLRKAAARANPPCPLFLKGKTVVLLTLLVFALPAFAQHEGHDMSQISQPESTTEKQQPSPTSLPPPTAEERAAAFPELHGMDMRDHMDDDPLIGMLQFDELEWQKDGGQGGLAWNLRSWLGRVDNRLWLRSEGERRDGRTEHGDVELLWGHATGPWWDAMLGVRRDFGEGAPRDWLAVGVQGLAPYKFEVAATAYVGESGRVAARAEAEYELLLSNRLILQPKLEANLYSRADPENGIGHGLGDAEFGLRLRYEFRREFAPYVGYVWSRRFGETADMAEATGSDRSEGQWVAGLRFWF